MTAISNEAERLRAFVESIRLINDQIAELQADRRDQFKEAKEVGFDTVIMKVLIKRMGLDPEDVIEAERILERYEGLLGTGALAAGTLSMKKDEDGRFVFEMVQGPPPDSKTTKKKQVRRDTVALAEAARRARGAL